MCVFCVQISLETEYLGPRRVEAFRREDEDWQRKAHTAVLSIQDLTVKYFETTARAQKGIKTRTSTNTHTHTYTLSLAM